MRPPMGMPRGGMRRLPPPHGELSFPDSRENSGESDDECLAVAKTLLL